MTSTSLFLDKIPYKLNDYIVLEILGEGSFGVVAKYFNVHTSEVVAIKILKNNQNGSTRNLAREVSILYALSATDPDKINIYRLFDFFSCDSYNCMVFEMLDRSLYDLMVQRQLTFELSEIRPITQQLLVAFEALKSKGIVHTDLKSDNVMLTNHKDQPLKVKLIDFGLAGHRSEFKLGMKLQCTAFRAPEVTLGLPLSEALDMWSLGCCLGEWYLGCNIFSGSSCYDNLRTIVHLLGQPNDEQLNKGLFTKVYFVQTNGSPQWRLKTPQEYTATTGKQPNVEKSPLDAMLDLDDAIKRKRSVKFLEYCDRMAFLSLLKNLLHLDPEKRMTPSEALRHSFITMNYLVETKPDYAQWARDLMTITLGDLTSGCAPQDESREEDLEPEKRKNEASSNNRDQTNPQPTGSTPGSEKESNLADVPCLTETGNQIEAVSPEDPCIDQRRDQEEESAVQHEAVPGLIDIETQTGVTIRINQHKDKQEQAIVQHKNIPCPIESDNQTEVNQPRDKQESPIQQEHVPCLTGMIEADSHEDINQSNEEEERSAHQSHQPTAETCGASNTAGSSENNIQSTVNPSPSYKSYITTAATIVRTLLYAAYLGIFVLVATVFFALCLINTLITNPQSPNPDSHTASRTTPTTTRRPSRSSSKGR